MSAHGLQGPTGVRGSAPCYNTRFKVCENHMGFFVLDMRKYPGNRRVYREGMKAVAGASSHYATRQEAIEVAVWLTDRVAGYPYNMLMAEEPTPMTIEERTQRYLNDAFESAIHATLFGDVQRRGPKRATARSGFDAVVEGMSPALKLGK